MAPLQQAIIPTACLVFWQVMFVCKVWKLQPLVRDHLTFDLIFISGASREIKESALPLFFRPNWRPKKNFLRPPPLPPLSQGLDVQDPLTAVSVSVSEKGETRWEEKSFFSLISPPRLAFLAWGDFHARFRFACSLWGLLVVYPTGSPTGVRQVFFRALPRSLSMWNQDGGHQIVNMYLQTSLVEFIFFYACDLINKAISCYLR